MAKELQQTEEACSEKEPKQQKPKLAIAEQITHLKSKGVKFAICDEEEATSFLADVCDFYEATSYRKLFTKRQGGKHDGEYIDLDFVERVKASLKSWCCRLLYRCLTSFSY